jgi:ketosteroid isomerase-like protein
MASPRVERLERTYSEMNQGRLDEALAIADPAIVWQTPTAFPGAPRFHSRDEVVAFFTEVLRSVDELRIEVESYDERGDQVLVVQRHFMRGAASGIDTERRMAHLWRFEGDRAVEFEAFHDVDEAVAEMERRETGEKRE